jgi:hypothetical protein
MKFSTSIAPGSVLAPVKSPRLSELIPLDTLGMLFRPYFLEQTRLHSQSTFSDLCLPLVPLQEAVDHVELSSASSSTVLPSMGLPPELAWEACLVCVCEGGGGGGAAGDVQLSDLFVLRATMAVSVSRGSGHPTINQLDRYPSRFWSSYSITMSSSAFASAFCPLSQSSTSTSPLGIQKPHLLTTYSHLPNRDIVHSNESMVYHTPAPIGVDLNYGFESKVERDPENDMEEHLDGLCQSLRRWVEGGGNLKSGSLITWRGMLTR